MFDTIKLFVYIILLLPVIVKAEKFNSFAVLYRLVKISCINYKQAFLDIDEYYIQSILKDMK